MIWTWILASTIALASPPESGKDKKESSSYAPKKAATGTYVFGWMDQRQSELKLRGGTTVGVPVTLETEPSEAWSQLQEDDIDTLERDRRAILAMVGDYRVSFDFLEVEIYGAIEAPSTPYRSWATERVEVLDSAEDIISLQHTLVMFMQMEDGSHSPPMLVKHGRQDWEYEPETALEFIGERHWETRKLSENERKGMWQQTVYQVDDSPRYAMRGTWEHNAAFSAWNSNNAWRPLPRREHTTRSDYHALIGTNRLTIHPKGWVHTQDNIKTVLATTKTIHADNPAVARELGINRYDRIRDFDFSAADKYWAETGAFWAKTRDAWNSHLQRASTVKVDTHCDDERVYGQLFALADKVAKKGLSDKKQQKGIDKVVTCAVSSAD